MSSPSEWWGAGSYERLAERLAPVHDALVEALDPRPGESWLDAATGTGAVAARAARAGAKVTAYDFAPALLEKARGAVAGLDVQLDLADARATPYADASFDVASSCFGVIFPPEREQVAAELARVVRPGGRLGLTAWKPDEELDAVWEPYLGDEPLPIDAWGDPSVVEELLGEGFELAIEERTWLLTGRDGAEVWSFLSESAPPVGALLAQVGPELGETLGQAYADVVERHRDGDDGGVRFPMRYLLVTGTRR